MSRRRKIERQQAESARQRKQIRTGILIGIPILIIFILMILSSLPSGIHAPIAVESLHPEGYVSPILKTEVVPGSHATLSANWSEERRLAIEQSRTLARQIVALTELPQREKILEYLDHCKVRLDSTELISDNPHGVATVDLDNGDLLIMQRSCINGTWYFAQVMIHEAVHFCHGDNVGAKKLLDDESTSRIVLYNYMYDIETRTHSELKPIFAVMKSLSSELGQNTSSSLWAMEIRASELLNNKSIIDYQTSRLALRLLVLIGDIRENIPESVEQAKSEELKLMALNTIQALQVSRFFNRNPWSLEDTERIGVVCRELQERYKPLIEFLKPEYQIELNKCSFELQESLQALQSSIIEGQRVLPAFRTKFGLNGR